MKNEKIKIGKVGVYCNCKDPTRDQKTVTTKLEGGWPLFFFTITCNSCGAYLTWRLDGTKTN